MFTTRKVKKGWLKVNEVEIINYLKKLRSKDTQAQFAKKLEISRSLYEKIENGVRNPSINFLKKLIKIDPNIDLNIFLK